MERQAAGVDLLGRNLLVLADLSAKHEIVSLEHTLTFCAHDGGPAGHQDDHTRLEKDNHILGRGIFPDIAIDFLAVRIEGTVDGALVLQVPYGICERIHKKDPSDHAPK